MVSPEAGATPTRQAVILGAADGLTLVVGLLLGMRHHSGAVFAAALSAGLAELVGMSAALWLSNTRNVKNFVVAMSCGVMTALACVIPALPYLFWGGTVALSAALALLAALGAFICWMRPEKGTRAALETYGLLLAAGALCFAATLL